ncbi:MAG: hypothetical protein PWP23_1344 [Candidatus Sumerlaeota bacterium]|nr:hypothetical protein [Candidatus Sumerlaeota bacterium]
MMRQATWAVHALMTAGLLTGAFAADKKPERGEAQPVGALTGATVFVNAGHGWHYSNGRWTTQRGPSHRIVEDLSNAETINQFLVPYLWNAGANVWTTRERDMQEHMVIVDSLDRRNIVSQGDWTLEQNDAAYGGAQLAAKSVSGTATARAGFVPEIPASGYYGVYVWYTPPEGETASEDAHIVIRHSGGSTTWVQNLNHDHSTWKYIGRYYFEAGRDPMRGAVVLENSGERAGRPVALSAVRFGGGMGDTPVEGVVSGKPRWEESGLYFAPFMGMPVPDEYDARSWNQVRAMPRYAEWEAEPYEKGRSIYVAWHTNGSDTHKVSGISTYIYSENAWGPPWDFMGYPGSDTLGRFLNDGVLHGVRAAWDPQWEDVGLITRWLGETNPQANAKMPAALIENGFHDNPHDAAYILEPEFRRISARAAYQSIVRYFHEEVEGFDNGTMLPEPPTHLRVVKAGMNRIEVAWSAPAYNKGEGVLGDQAESYRVYRSRNGYGFDNGTETEDTTFELVGIVPGQVEYVRVAAVNEGGESFATETLAVRAPERNLRPQVLLVNGFDRLDRGMNLVDDTTFPGHEFERTILAKMNTFDYAVQHAEALHAAGWNFDSASNEALIDGDVRLGDYSIVVWILGNEGEGSTLDGNERRLVRQYLEGGGSLFLSGANIGWDLDAKSRDIAGGFHRELFKSECLRNAALTNSTRAVAGTLFAKAGDVDFDDGTGTTYSVRSADVLKPLAGARTLLTYANSASGEAAAIACDGPYRLVYLAFPFETITDPKDREEIMARSLAFLNREID